MDENFLMEMATIKVGIVPVDLNAGANAGARIPFSKCKRISFIFNFGASTAAAVNITVQQHNAASSGTSKALTIDPGYFHKHGTATSFTKVEPTGTPYSSLDIASLFAADAGVFVIDVKADDLDVENDFGWVSMSLDDTTATKLGSCIAVMYDTVQNPPYGQVV